MKVPLAISIAAAAISMGSQAAEQIGVWPDGKIPGETGSFGPEVDTTKPDGNKIAGKRLIRLGNVTVPILEVRPAPADKANGAAVVICPGGGYHILAWDLEGTEVADWLNSIGVTAFVLKYRVPRRPDQEPWAAPLKDAQRAMSLVRHRAADWKIDPKRIGILGFSAGANLSFRACAQEGGRHYVPIDAVDQTPWRPDFAVLVYSAWLHKEGTLELQDEFEINAQSPPMFFAHAHDDPINSESSVAAYIALKKAKVAADLHVYAKGGHGFGLRRTDAPVTRWPDRCAEWLGSLGLLTKK